MPRLRLALAAAALALAAPAAAQAPLPTDLPWNAPFAAARARLARLGFTPAPPGTRAQGDRSIIFAANRGGVDAQLRTQFREGQLFHAFYVAQGDSVSLQGEIDRSVSAVSARFGQPATASDGVRVWSLPDGRRFAIPAAPWRADANRYAFAVVYHRP